MSRIDTATARAYLKHMIELAQILEDVWERAAPGREAAARNELLRELRELLRPRFPAPRLTLVATRTAR
jgi:hypothetical protein